ncbi:MAG: DUF1049 domain-containing protein [Endozoicomonadaceae bacterium]|nr:DUF1049 domain-containing protein [Endozoicomonadaceae bacterium]
MVIRWLRLLLWLLFAVALCFIAFSFVIENSDAVTLVIVGYSLAPASLSSIVVSSFILGGLMGVFSGVVMVTLCRVRQALLRRKSEQQEAELKKLRMNTLKGLS